MARRGKKTEERADKPVRLSGSVKARLKEHEDKYGLRTHNEGVSILLDIAQNFGKDIEIQTKPSVTIKGS